MLSPDCFTSSYVFLHLFLIASKLGKKNKQNKKKKFVETLCSLFLNAQDITGAVSGYEVPPPHNVLKLPVVRQAGRFGSVTLSWEAIHSTASFEDFTPSFGNLTFADGQVCTC